MHYTTCVFYDIILYHFDINLLTGRTELQDEFADLSCCHNLTRLKFQCDESQVTSVTRSCKTIQARSLKRISVTIAAQQFSQLATLWQTAETLLTCPTRTGTTVTFSIELCSVVNSSEPTNDFSAEESFLMHFRKYILLRRLALNSYIENEQTRTM